MPQLKALANRNNKKHRYGGVFYVSAYGYTIHKRRVSDVPEQTIGAKEHHQTFLQGFCENLHIFPLDFIQNTPFICR